MKACDHCQEPVSDRFHRQYAVNGRLVACHQCSPKTRLSKTIRIRHPDLKTPARSEVVRD